MIRPYYYVRFRWWTSLRFDEAERELGEFKFRRPNISLKEDMELTLYRDERDEAKVSADTLSAYLSAYRAVIFQKEAKPFTKRDLDLRNHLIRLYDRNTPTPFPFLFSIEPEFEVETGTSIPCQ